MNVGQWMRVLDTVGGLAQMSSRLRRPTVDEQPPAGAGPLGQLEARLAGVVVAALKEAFDRDRARLDLERAQMDAEQHRAEVALLAELRRQAAERMLGQLRLIAIVAAGVWMLSAGLGVWLPNVRQVAPLLLLALGWGAAIGAIGCALLAWQQVSGVLTLAADVLPLGAHGSGTASSAAGPHATRRSRAAETVPGTARAALALLLASLTLTGAALLAAL